MKLEMAYRLKTAEKNLVAVGKMVVNFMTYKVYDIDADGKEIGQIIHNGGYKWNYIPNLDVAPIYNLTARSMPKLLDIIVAEKLA